MKKGLISILLCVTMMLTGGVAYADNHSAGGPEDAEKWYKDVFAAAFINGDEDFFAKFYPSSFFYVSEGEATQYDPKSFEAWVMKKYVNGWLEAGWVNTKLVSMKTVPVSSGLVVLTARWSMTDKDGKPATGCALPGWHYVLAKQKDSWVVTTESEAACPSSK